MFYSLETRIPFLNSKVTQFASELPYELKMSQFWREIYIKRNCKKVFAQTNYFRKKWDLVFH